MVECTLAHALIIGGKRCLKDGIRRNDQDSARDSASPTLDFRAQKIQTVTGSAFSANPGGATAMPFGVIGLSWPRGFKTFPAVLFIRVLLPTLPPIPAGRQRTHPGTDRSGKTGPRKSPLPAPIDNPAPLPYIPPIHPGERVGRTRSVAAEGVAPENSQASRTGWIGWACARLHSGERRRAIIAGAHRRGSRNRRRVAPLPNLSGTKDRGATRAA